MSMIIKKITPKILAIDDKKENLLALEAVLEEFNCEMILAKSGEEGLKLILEHEFALALVDVQMPGMNGFETAQLMRGIKRSKHLPIIFITALNEQPDYEFKGYEAGGVDFLFKPVNPEILKSKTKVFLDLYEQKALISNQAIELKKKEERATQEIEIRKHAEKVLKEVTHQNELILNCAGEGIFGLDLQEKITFINPAALSMIGYPSHEIIEQSQNFLIKGDSPEGDISFQNTRNQSKVQFNETMFKNAKMMVLNKNGTTLPVEVTSTPITENGNKIGVVVVFQDITDRLRQEKELLMANEELESRVKEKTADLVRAIQNLEKSESQLKEFSTELQESNLVKDKVIDELNRLKKDLEKTAKTDFLTGLFNRREIEVMLNNEKNRFERYGRSFSIVFADIDHFKMINDTYGHEAGDCIIVRVAEILEQNSRKQDLVCRWGGEEFLLFLPETPLEGGIVLANKLRALVEAEKFQFQDQVLQVTMSFGVSVYDEAKTSIMDCIKRADECLYLAKKSGRNRVC